MTESLLPRAAAGASQAFRTCLLSEWDGWMTAIWLNARHWRQYTEDAARFPHYDHMCTGQPSTNEFWPPECWDGSPRAHRCVAVETPHSHLVKVKPHDEDRSSTHGIVLPVLPQPEGLHTATLLCCFVDSERRAGGILSREGPSSCLLLPGWAAETPGKPVLGERLSQMTSIDEVLHLFWLHRSSKLQTSTIERESAKSPHLPRKRERTEAGCSPSHFLSLSPSL